MVTRKSYPLVLFLHKEEYDKVSAFQSILLAACHNTFGLTIVINNAVIPNRPIIYHFIPRLRDSIENGLIRSGMLPCTNYTLCLLP